MPSTRCSTTRTSCVSSPRRTRSTTRTRSRAWRASASTRSASAATSRSSSARSRSRSARSRTSRCRRSIRELAEEERGIVLLTGTTGSGKSTTLAAMVDHINSTRARHIVTIEDPIEFLHVDKQSLINQREVGQDTASFKRALRRVLRQDPDVILIGEMRDEETVHTALSAAETGPPRLLDGPHRRRRRDRQPPDRLLPAAHAPAGARDARRHAQGRRLPAPRPVRQRRPRRGLRDPADDRPRPRHDHGPHADRARSPRSSRRAPTTGCRPSTRRCSST